MLFTPQHDWWKGTRLPRDWQARALPVAVRELGSTNPKPSLIQAVMGAGKSVLIAELCAQARPADDEVIVVTTSSQALVEQLSSSIAQRTQGAVGRYYTHAKQANRSVVVACVDSAGKLAYALERQGRRCALWLADEAHRTEADTVKSAAEVLEPKAVLGFTATPYRSKKTEELSLFTQLIYAYGPAEGLRDGCILPWKVIPWEGGECSLDDACMDMIREQEGPGVCNARSIHDAEDYAARLTAAGIPAQAIHSLLDKGVQARRLAALQNGELRCLVHVSMLQEGVDLPWLRWLCLRRPSSSRVRFAQEVGRVLRVDPHNPDKKVGVILDPQDLFGSFKLNYDAVLQGGAEEALELYPAFELYRDGDWWRSSVNPLEACVGPGSLLRLWQPNQPSPQEQREVGDIRRDGLKLTGEPLAFPDAQRLCARRFVIVEESEAEKASLALFGDSGGDEEEATVARLDAIARYLRALGIELEARYGFERRVMRRQLREYHITPRQWQRFRAALEQAGPAMRQAPEPHRSALRRACLAAHEMSYGPLQDLIDLLVSIPSIIGEFKEAHLAPHLSRDHHSNTTLAL